MINVETFLHLHKVCVCPLKIHVSSVVILQGSRPLRHDTQWKVTMSLGTLQEKRD